jgi:hypothetical protein
MLELLPAVIGLGRRGEDLGEDLRVEERVPPAVLERGALLHDDDVRIRIEARRAHLEAQARRVHLAGLVGDAPPDLAREVRDDEAVLAARRLHRDDLAPDELVALGRGPLRREVVFGREDRLRGRGGVGDHPRSIPLRPHESGR